MKKKNILLALALMASVSLASCGSDNPQTFVRDRGSVDNTPSNIVFPEEVTNTPGEEPTIPTGDNDFNFDDGDSFEIDAGSGESVSTEDYRILTANANIGYEFVGWYKGDTLVSTNPTYKVSKDETNIIAKFNVKKEFEDFIFASTETTCQINGIKDASQTEVVIPEGVTSVSRNAFSDTNVVFAKLPKTLQTLPLDLFRNNYLFSIELHSYPTFTPTSGGYYTSSLREVLVGEEVEDEIDDISYALEDNVVVHPVSQGSIFKMVGEYLFSYSEFTGYALEAYFGTSKNIVLPQATDDIPSYQIGQTVFYGSDIESVTFSSAVTEICYQAFSGCNQLKEVTIPDSVKAIDAYAFYSCKSLERVTIGNGCESIGNDAFENCSSLSVVVIGTNVEQINYSAFYGCTSLYTVYNLSNLNLEAESSDYGNVAYYAFSVLKSLDAQGEVKTLGDFIYVADSDNNEVTILKYTGQDKNVIIPSFDNYKIHIGEGAFQNNKDIETVTLNSSVDEIGAYAFLECANLKSIDLTNVYSLGYRAFSGCILLSEAKLTHITSIPTECFKNCKSLIHLEMPIVENIGQAAFVYCGMYQVTLPSTLTTIYSTSNESYAPFGYTHIAEVINNSSLSISKESSGNGYVAYHAKSVISGTTASQLQIDDNGLVTYTYNGVRYLVGLDNADIKKLVIPDTIHYIFQGALAPLQQVEEIEFGELGNNIAYYFGASSYYGYEIVPKSLKKVVVSDSVEAIGPEYFYELNLDSLEISKSVVRFENYAFLAANIKDIYYGGTIDDWVKCYMGNDKSSPLCNEGVKLYMKEGSEYVPLGKTIEITGATKINQYMFQGQDIEEVIIHEGVETIGIKAFYNCKNLKKVTFPSTLISIDEYAFANCSLDSIEFNDNLESIGYCAFENNSSFKTLVIPQSVTSMDGYAFANCSRLLSLTLSEGITSIGSYAFSGCTLLYTINLPTTLETIGYGAFEKCETLESIDLSNTQVTELEEEVFLNCTSLINVSFPENITSIGDSTFQGCPALQYTTYKNGCYFGTPNNPYRWLIKARTKTILDCTIHPNCEKVYAGAFSNCTNLKKLIIPSSVTDLGSIASGIASLEYIECPYASSSSFGSMIFGTSNTNIPSNLKTVVINGGTIPTNAFKDWSTIESVSLNFETDTIPESAFQNCTSLENITLPTGLVSIGKNAFSNTALKSFTATSTMKSILERAFQNCTSLESIDLTDMICSTYSFGDYAFANCSNLSSVTLPTSMTIVGKYMFNNCKELKSITLPNSVTSIGQHAFDGAGLTSINFNNVDTLGEYAFARTDLETVTLSNKIKTIGTYTFFNAKSLKTATVNYKTVGHMFDGCSVLETVTLATSITSIADYAFRVCSSLKNINLSNVTNYGSYSFYQAGLTSVTLASGVTLGAYTFAECNDLASVNIQGAITTSNGYQFDACKNLTTVTSASTFKEVPVGFFRNCSSLQTFDFTNVTYIKESGFEGAGFTTLTIPSTVSLGIYAFKNCKSLTSLTMESAFTSATAKGLFSGCSSLTTVVLPSDNTIIPESTFKDCKSLTNFDFTNIEMIKAYAFQNTGIVELVLPDTITSMGQYAFDTCVSLVKVTSSAALSSYIFANCKELEEVIILGGTTKIPDYAFSNCKKLTSVSLSDSITAINGDAFYNSGVVEFTIPDSVTTVASYAFYQCESLESVVIGSGVESIGDNAFRGCLKLNEVYNLSSLTIEKGSTENGYVAYYAKVIHTSLSEPSCYQTVGDYKFLITEDGNYLVAYLGNSTSLVLPSSFEYNGQTITNYDLAARLFYDNDDILSIRIPDSVKVIGEEAFYSCDKLVNVSLGNSIETIGPKAFAYCNRIYKLVLGQNVTSIGDMAFYGTYRLAEIWNLSNISLQSRFDTTYNDNAINPGYLGDYSMIIHTEASIDSILEVDSNGFVVTVFNNTPYIVGYIGYADSITIPASFNYKGENYTDVYVRSFALASEKFATTIIIPEGVYYLSERSISYLSQTKLLVVDPSVQASTYAFWESWGIDCAKASASMMYYITHTSRRISNTNYTYTGMKMAYLTSGTMARSYLFASTSTLECVVIPKTITYFDNYSFTSCSNLATVFYEGTEEDKANIYFSYAGTITSATWYFFSETKPEAEGNYWHYVDGIPTIWEE